MLWRLAVGVIACNDNRLSLWFLALRALVSWRLHRRRSAFVTTIRHAILLSLLRRRQLHDGGQLLFQDFKEVLEDRVGDGLGADG